MKKKYTNFSQFSFNSFHHPACFTLRVFYKFGKKQCVRNHLKGTRQTQREITNWNNSVTRKNRILSSRLIPISSQFFDKVASSTTYSFVVDKGKSVLATRVITKDESVFQFVSSDQLCGRQSGNPNKLNLSAFERFSYPYQVDLIVESLDKQRLTRYFTNLVEIRFFFDCPEKQLQMRKHIFDIMF